MPRTLPLLFAFGALVTSCHSAAAAEGPASSAATSRRCSAVSAATPAPATGPSRAERLPTDVVRRRPGARPSAVAARVGGRRLNSADPDASLLLLKATARIGHEGGKRTASSSREYDILRRWIAAGAKLDPPEPLADRETPSHARRSRRPGPDRSIGLRVEATFADGSAEDVTGLCSYDSLDSQVAAVDGSGRVEARGVGDTALIVRYRAEPALALVVVPRPAKEPFPEVAGHNFIDQHVLAKLRRLNLPPAAVAEDSTFLRRAVAGRERRIADAGGSACLPGQTGQPDKRSRKIDELLGDPATRRCGR